MSLREYICCVPSGGVLCRFANIVFNLYSSRCSSFGNKGTIDSPSDSDEFGEEVIYSHESPKADEIIRDFDWELGRFVQYSSPLTRNKILSLGSHSSHWNINNSSVVIDNQRNEIKKLNHQDRTRVGTEIVIDIK
jgi:hypothetical protein